MRRIEVLLGVLGLVIGTFGSTANQNETTVGFANASESVLYDDKASTMKIAMKIEDVTKGQEIDIKMNNHSDEIVDELLLTKRPINDTKNVTIFLTDDFNTTEIQDKPKNIILVMVEGGDSENSWKELKKNHLFAVQGFFQNCAMHKKFNGTNINATTDDEKCDCHELLKSNMSELIIYARSIKGMNTVTLSEGNFTLPTSLGFDKLPHHYHHHKSKSIENMDEVAGSPAILEFHPQLINDSQLLNIDKKLAKSSSQSSMSNLIKASPPATAHTLIKRHENTNNKDKVWDFFDMITKIRLDFIKNIIDSLHKSPVFNSNRNINSRKQSLVFPIQRFSTIIDLISNNLMNLKAAPNDKGFLMIIVAPHNELSAIYKMIQNQTSTKDLIIMSGLDTTVGKQSIPYVANGPGSNYFNNLQTIHELPSTIKLTLEHCQGICDNKELPLITSLPVKSFTSKKRIARSEDEETPADEEKTEKDGGENESGQDDGDAGGGGDDDSAERDSSSGISLYFERDSVTPVLSIVSSIITTFLLYT